LTVVVKVVSFMACLLGGVLKFRRTFK